MNLPQVEIDPCASLRGKVVAVLNNASGGFDANAGARMEEIFLQSGLPAPEILTVAPTDIDQVLAEAAARASVIVVLGGDGTIRAAAARCGESGALLIPLPGGTMNMLPRALYGEARWDAALTSVLAAPSVRDVSGGVAEGHVFFCAAILGAPSLWSDAREALRHGDVVEAVARSRDAIRRRAHGLKYTLGEAATGTAEGVAVICPLVSRALHENDASLEAAALEPLTAGAMFRLMFHAIFDDWRLDPGVSLARVKTVSVGSRGRVPAILDGEKFRMGRRVTVTFLPLAFRAIVAAPPPPASDPQSGDSGPHLLT